MSDKLTIRTNHKPRPVLSRYELTADESAEFDYLAPDDGSFFRYKGRVYDLGEFCRVSPQFSGWDGYSSDSFFSGLLVKYCDGWESVVVGLYLS